MADYDDINVGQLVETTAHINGWQKIRRLLFGSVKVHDLADGSQLYMKTGTYTGDGAATKAITVETGFQPRFLIVYSQVDNNNYIAFKSSSDGTKTKHGAVEYEDDYIISLDANGFTVGDGTGGTNGNQSNVNLQVYTYIAFR